MNFFREIIQVREKSGNWAKNSSSQGNVGKLSKQFLKSGKSWGIEQKNPQVREKSGNWANNASSQGKVGELSKKFLKSGKSRGIEQIMPQVREKLGNWANNASSQGKVGELSKNNSSQRKVRELNEKKSEIYLRLRKSRGIKWKLFQIRDESGNWVKIISGQGKVVELCEKYLRSGLGRGIKG